MKTTRKGGIILKILAVLALLLMIIAIQVPQKMWAEQTAREELARKRMLDMNECEIAYMQEVGSYEKDLKKVYDYITTHNMALGAPEIETEILAIDTSSMRLNINDYKHCKDLSVVRADKEELVKLPGLITRPNEHHYYCGNEVVIRAMLRDEKLGLYSDYITLKADDSIKAVAVYKNEKDIFWDFSAAGKIKFTRNKVYSLQAGKDQAAIVSYFNSKKIEIVKSIDGANQLVFLNDAQLAELSASFDPTAYLQEAQSVSMARYLLTDIDTDTEPYLCPSTKDPFKVNFNLSGKFFLKVKFFNADTKGAVTGDLISGNEKAYNFFLNMVKLKADRKVNDFVREKEIEGDKSFSSQAKKDELFAKHFNEFLSSGLKDAAISDSISNTLTATDETQEQDFSDEKKMEILFTASPGELALSESKKPANAALLNKVLFSMKIGSDKVDVTSLKISSPITETSTFRGYTRSFLQSRSLFGVSDDKNHGFVDNGRASWKKE